MKQSQPLFPNSYGEGIPFTPSTNGGLTPPSSFGHGGTPSNNNGINYPRTITPPPSLERERGGLRNSGSFAVPVRGPTPPMPNDNNVHQRRSGGPPRGPGGALFDDLGTGDFFNNPVAQIGLSYGQKWAEDASEKYKQGVRFFIRYNQSNPYNPPSR